MRGFMPLKEYDVIIDTSYLLNLTSGLGDETLGSGWQETMFERLVSCEILKLAIDHVSYTGGFRILRFASEHDRAHFIRTMEAGR